MKMIGYGGLVFARLALEPRFGSCRGGRMLSGTYPLIALGGGGSSVVLNVAEGSGSFGRMRTARYRTALGSARETLACLRTAEAWGYVEAVPKNVVSSKNRVIGTLVRVAA
jgi:hypothetical protein